MYDAAFSKCPDYDGGRVYAAVKEAVDAVGGLGWLRPGMTVAVKLNLVSAEKPERAATTHPAVAAAVCRLISERGGVPVCGDSPGGPFASAWLKRVYSACGLDGLPLNRDFSERRVECPEGERLRGFDCTAWLLKADAIVDVCKLKTHGMMGFTAGVKNMFGAVQGTKKPELHFRFREKEAFASALADICAHLRPALTVCDAVDSMDGNGPTSGRPRRTGLVAAAGDPFTLDLCLARYIGLEPLRAPTVAASLRRGLAKESPLVLNEPEPLADFDIPEPGGLLFEGRGGAMGALRSKLLGRLLESRPELESAKCVSCGRCRDVCPASAIEMADSKPRIDRKKCIKCFCCQEFCPAGALHVRRGAVARLLDREVR